MIFWIEKKYKNEYINSAHATGIRYKFIDYVDEITKNEIKNFICYIRKQYYFPIRLNISLYNYESFKHEDGHKYYGIFYDGDNSKKIYPKINIAAKTTNRNPVEDIIFAIAHEITHYYQWYFLEDKNRTHRSLEIEANKWAAYILDYITMVNL